MGVHTGDSITVAPAQTLSDVEYQEMRNAAFACIRRVGVETGGSNVQFALDPATGRQVIIEMNPRVSRSSALASKATGFPIAKIATKLAVGYTLDEIPNDITQQTPACFEPSIDYVVTKVPRWAFEKLPGTSGVLGTQMQSVGEVMAIGRTFPESLQKALRSLEQGRLGLNADPAEGRLAGQSTAEPARRRRHADAGADLPGRRAAPPRHHDRAGPRRLPRSTRGSSTRSPCIVERARRAGGPRASRRWTRRIVAAGQAARVQRCPAGASLAHRRRRRARRRARRPGCCRRTRRSTRAPPSSPPSRRTTTRRGRTRDEVRPSDRPRVDHPRIGAEPHRPGHRVRLLLRARQLRAVATAGFETVMVNCNPETVSTDYDTSDRLYFEPLTAEDVHNVIAAETAAAGGVAPKVIVALGGQTPLKLAAEIPAELVAGTTAESIDAAEDREKWNRLCHDLGIPQPPGGTAVDLDQALGRRRRVGYPVLVRPSYVLGGRAMRIVHDEGQLREAMDELAGHGSLGREGGLSADRPVLIDRFLDDAVEVDVDAVRDDAGEVLIGGVMEHVEEAGVHSGDSACAIPPPTLVPWVIEVIKAYTAAIAARLDVRGLLNVQYAVRGTTVFVIEANPRASRTVPFVAKATGVPLAKVATRVMLGATLAELRDEGLLRPSVLDGDAAQHGRRQGGRAAVLAVPRRRPGARSGDALDRRGDGHRHDVRAGVPQGRAGRRHGARDRGHGVPVARRSRQAGRAGRRQAPAPAGMGIVATKGTADYLAGFGEPVDAVVAKVSEVTAGGDDKTAVDLIASGEGDVRRQHAPGQRRPLRRRGDPQGGRAARRGVRDDDQRGARRRAGSPRAAWPTPVGALAPGAPCPPRPEISDSAIGADRPVCRRKRRWPVRIGSVTLKNPVMTASGTAGYGTELAASFDLAELGAVVVKSLAAFEWPGNPAAAAAPDAGRDVELGRPAGPRTAALARARASRSCCAAARRSSPASGADRSTSTERRPSCSPSLPTASSRSRSTCRAPICTARRSSPTIRS